MKNKQKTESLIYILIALFLLVVSVIGGRAMLPAFADTAEYTSALEDLQKDESFSISDYPEKPTDYSIKVIQVAEGVDGELFIYTYQPCQNSRNLTAKCINMSLSENFYNANASYDPEAITRILYLTLINTSGVFGKYKVTGFTVSSSPVRYYNITSIYRDKIAGIDKETGNDNTVNGIAYNVGQVWRVTTTSNGIKYEMKEVETIEITSKYVGTISYQNGISWFTTSACFSHFVAFSTNRRIDELLEADVYYETQSFKRDLYGNVKVGSKEPQHVSLTSDQTTGNAEKGIFGESYTWQRIMSAADFVSRDDVELPAEVSREIKSKQWVLSFAEEEITGNVGVLSSNIVSTLGILFGSPLLEGTYVSDVSILRLKFVTDGVTYNLGVVDNKQTGTNTPVATGKFDFFEYVWSCVVKLFTGQASAGETVVAVVAIILAVFVLIVVGKLLSYLKPIFKWAFSFLKRRSG